MQAGARRQGKSNLTILFFFQFFERSTVFRFRSVSFSVSFSRPVPGPVPVPFHSRFPTSDGITAIGRARDGMASDDDGIARGRIIIQLIHARACVHIYYSSNLHRPDVRAIEITSPLLSTSSLHNLFFYRLSIIVYRFPLVFVVVLALVFVVEMFYVFV